MITLFSTIITIFLILIMMELMPPLMIMMFTWAGVFVVIRGGVRWISQQRMKSSLE